MRLIPTTAEPFLPAQINTQAIVRIWTKLGTKPHKRYSIQTSSWLSPSALFGTTRKSCTTVRKMILWHIQEMGLDLSEDGNTNTSGCSCSKRRHKVSIVLQRITTSEFQKRERPPPYSTHCCMISQVGSNHTWLPARRFFRPSRLRLKPFLGSNHGNSLFCEPNMNQASCQIHENQTS